MKTSLFWTMTLFCFIAFGVHAQNSPKSFIGVTAGLSTPLGAFSKKDAGTFNHWNNTAGFAKNGYTIGIEGAHYFFKNIGLGGAINFSDHGGFNEQDVHMLADSYTDAFAVDESTVTTSGSYQSLTVMIGPCVSFPIKKFTIDVRALAGLMASLSTPVMTVQLEDQTDASFRQANSTGSAFGWQLGAGLRYSIGNRFSISYRADYFHSDGIKIKNENRTNNAGRLVSLQPMSWINNTIGIAVSL